MTGTLPSPLSTLTALAYVFFFGTVACVIGRGNIQTELNEDMKGEAAAISVCRCNLVIE